MRAVRKAAASRHGLLPALPLVVALLPLRQREMRAEACMGPANLSGAWGWHEAWDGRGRPHKPSRGMHYHTGSTAHALRTLHSTARVGRATVQPVFTIAGSQGIWWLEQQAQIINEL